MYSNIMLLQNQHRPDEITEVSLADLQPDRAVKPPVVIVKNLPKVSFVTTNAGKVIINVEGRSNPISVHASLAADRAQLEHHLLDQKKLTQNQVQAVLAKMAQFYNGGRN